MSLGNILFPRRLQDSLSGPGGREGTREGPATGESVSGVHASFIVDKSSNGVPGGANGPLRLVLPFKFVDFGISKRLINGKRVFK